MTKLYILCGIPFSGKSTLANEMVKILGVKRVDLDEIKFEIYGQNTMDEDLNQSHWDKIYQEMYKRIENNLKAGKSVVNDTGNFTKYERGLIADIAKRVNNVSVVTIYVDTPYDVAKERLNNNRIKQKRFNISDKSFESAVKEMEKPDDKGNTLTYHHNLNVEEWIKDNL